MRFGVIAMIYIVAALTGYLTGAGMALLGYGYWALVGASVTQGAVQLVLAWLISGWRPKLPSRNTQTWHMLTFGANITAGSLIYSLARGADNLLIGRFFGAAAVGLYSRASVLLIRPLQQFTIPINSVLVPTLSRIQTEPDRYRRTFLRVYEAMALVSFLCTGLLLALARPLTLVVLGLKWEQAAPIFAGFSIAALCIPLAGASTWLFQTQGRGKDLLINSLLGSCVTVASYVAGLRFGPAGVAIAYSVGGLFIGVPILFYFAGRQGPVTTADLWSAIFRYLPLWIVVCGVTWLLRLLVMNSAPLVQLLVCAPVGLLAGAILICVVPSMRRVAFSLLDILLELKSRSGFYSANSIAPSVPLAQAAPVRAMWGVFDRKERWCLSWRGRLIVASALLLVGALVLKGVYPFLAITHRVDANILVVEGWINEHAIRAAVKEFQSNHYERVFTTGGPTVGTGGYINDFYTSASVGADLLKRTVSQTDQCRWFRHG